MALYEIFPSIRKHKRNFNNSSLSSQTKSNIYTKKGTLKENQINLLYNLTQNKLSKEYINKLTQLLYNCKSIKNYSLKRINLDKAVYKYDNKNELYITLPNFNYKNKSVNDYNNKNSSIHNFTENRSNYLTNDTNYNVSCNNNISCNNQSVINKGNKKYKFDLNDMLEQLEEEKLNKTIKKLLLNEDLEMPKKTERQIFNRLNMKYKFEDSQSSDRFITRPKLQKRYEAYKNNANKNVNLIFPKINNNRFVDYLEILKTKTDELNSIKQKNHKNYLSPLFFLGKNKKNYLNNIKYISYKQLNSKKKIKDFKNISEENKKYLQTMIQNINTLNEINNENKDILESKIL